MRGQTLLSTVSVCQSSVNSLLISYSDISILFLKLEPHKYNGIICRIIESLMLVEIGNRIWGYGGGEGKHSNTTLKS